MNSNIEILNPEVKKRIGHIKFALIDFDGTISVIRQGWEEVMIPLMMETIYDGNPSGSDIEKEIREYVDYSTGILTIKQMQWLTKAVRRYSRAKKPKKPYEYKRIYNQRLLIQVKQRLKKLQNGELKPDDLMIMGAREFLKEIHKQNVTMYLASGTDHEYVLQEASALKVNHFFKGRIYGAIDYTESNSKEKIIQRILEEYDLHGAELLVIGDGPVEIRNAKLKGAIALGLATDEVKRFGLNPRKRIRLINAGADLIISDFIRSKKIISLLFKE